MRVTDLLDALKGEAGAALFPLTVVPVSADVVTLFEFFVSDFRIIEFVDDLTELHALSLKSHPELARFIRGGAVTVHRARAAAAAAARFGRTDVDTFAIEQYEQFERQIAEQLVGLPEFEPNASLLATELTPLYAQLKADVARRQAHERAEQERLEAERRLAEEIIAAAEQQRRNTL